MIIEGLLTTTTSDGLPHVAAMGPMVDASLQAWTLRPFASSNTFRCLRANPHCVFHVVDDVVPVVEAALGMPTSLSFERLQDGDDFTTERCGLPAKESTAKRESGHDKQPRMDTMEQPQSPEQFACWTIPSACHWYQLTVTDWDTTQPRSVAKARLIQQRVQRPFWGWNRAKHAILEATILASRIHFLERDSIAEDLAKFELAIHKTAGERELHAWQLLKDFFQAST